MKVNCKRCNNEKEVGAPCKVCAKNAYSPLDKVKNLFFSVGEMAKRSNITLGKAAIAAVLFVFIGVPLLVDFLTPKTAADLEAEHQAIKEAEKNAAKHNADYAVIKACKAAARNAAAIPSSVSFSFADSWQIENNDGSVDYSDSFTMKNAFGQELKYRIKCHFDTPDSLPKYDIYPVA